MNSITNIRGVELYLKREGEAEIANLDKEMDLLYCYEDVRIRIGLLDLEGKHVYQSGENNIIKLDGEHEIM